MGKYNKMVFDFSPPEYELILKNVFLTPREKKYIEIKREYYGEISNEKIAEMLNISPRQLQRNIKQLSMKIGKFIYEYSNKNQ